MRLKGKVAIITGASRGIGAEIARFYAKEGASIVLAARSLDKLEEIRAEIKEYDVDCLVLKVDTCERNEVKDMADKTYKHYGCIDILVNNAGYPMFGFPIDDLDPEAEERYEAILQTNLRGYWYSARFVVPYMKKKNRGSIINISSVRGHLGVMNDSAYCAAKGAVNMLTRSLSVELAQYNIRVNTISPGAIQVDLGHWVLSRYGEEAHKTYVERFSEIHLLGMKINQPLRTIGLPEDVAYSAIYFASDESKFVTGADLYVDGGLLSLMAEPGSLDLKSLNEYYKKSMELNKWLSTLK